MTHAIETAGLTRRFRNVDAVEDLTLRFVDSDHASPDAASRIAARYPNAEIRMHPMTLREIFVVLARRSAREPGKEAAS